MKYFVFSCLRSKLSSPSVWRVWIEIDDPLTVSATGRSPSVWRVWIEIPPYAQILPQVRSPSVWRVWIEILFDDYASTNRQVTLRVEGVD